MIQNPTPSRCPFVDNRRLILKDANVTVTLMLICLSSDCQSNVQLQFLEIANENLLKHKPVHLQINTLETDYNIKKIKKMNIIYNFEINLNN